MNSCKREVQCPFTPTGIDFLPDAKHLSAVDKSTAFANIPGRPAWSHVQAYNSV